MATFQFSVKPNKFKQISSTHKIIEFSETNMVLFELLTFEATINADVYQTELTKFMRAGNIKLSAWPTHNQHMSAP